MRTGLASLKEIETPEGRKKMNDWLVMTPKGVKARIVSVSPNGAKDEWSVTVFGDFGFAEPAHQTFNAAELWYLKQA